MAKSQREQHFLQMETVYVPILNELKVIWDEIGESEEERAKILTEMERECLEVYRKKVDQANRSRAQLQQAIADSEAEIATICSVLGQTMPVHLLQRNKRARSLTEEMKEIHLLLEEMRRRRSKRHKEFLEVLKQIKDTSAKIRPSEQHSSFLNLDETDLSVKKLEDLQKQLLLLQKEKNDRLKKILDYLDNLNSLCLVIGIDFKQTVKTLNPSLDGDDNSKDISDDTITALATEVERLRDVKLQRMQKLQDLATTLLELWHLMDTPMEEQQNFQKVTCNIAASEEEIREPGVLALDAINCVEAEVRRLEALKTTKMKELLVKKKAELNEFCSRAHLIVGGDHDIESALEHIEAGTIDPSFVLGHMEVQISMVKEEAFSRKEILERVEKWLSACEEESWLEEYNRDKNRYNSGRGVHLALRRAEKARVTVNKIPGMVESLVSKTTAWEKERGTEFMYDGLHLLSMLEEYSSLRQEKEQERRHQKDERRLQGQLLAEQEVLYGSKPSPMKLQNAKKVLKTPRKVSSGANNFQLSKPDSLPPVSTGMRSTDATVTPRKPFVPLVPDSNLLLTPSKPITVNIEDMTPTAMRLVNTPAPASRISEDAVSSDPEEEAEYSFEERRAGFVMPSTQTRYVSA